MNSLRLSKSQPWQYVLLGFLILLLGLGIWSVTHTQQLKDWYILETYTPPLAVKQIASSDAFTPYAKELFFVNKPHLDSKAAFAGSCPNGIEQTYVIGCYVSGDNGIFLLNVQDNQLNGIVQVTAAYEMLHAGYARLPDTQKASLDKQMWSFYLSSVSSDEIKQQMAAYAASEPGEQYDELYSVLATEVDNLPSSLEAHFKRYFYNRSALVALYNHYQAVFTSRQQILSSDDQELASLRQQIDQNDNALNTELATINSQMKMLENERINGSTNTYNSDTAAYNASVNQYNQLVLTTKSEIDEYNNLVVQRNSLVLEEQQLIQAISSSPSPKSL